MLSASDVRPAVRTAARCAALPGLSPERKAEFLLERGRALAVLGDHLGAQAELRAALAAVPGDARARLLLARELRQRPDEAVIEARAALEAARGPRGRRDALRLLGEIQEDLGDASGATASFERALQEGRGDDLDALIRLARLESGRSRAAAGRRARRASEAAARAPLWRRRAALRRCARLWLELGEPAGALQSLRAALDVYPHDLDALEAAVRIRSDHKGARWSPRREARNAPEPAGRSEEELARDLAADPADVDALREVARRAVTERRADAAQTVARLEDALRDAPLWQQPPGYVETARLWIALERADDARRALEQAKELDKRALDPLLVEAEPGTLQARLMGEIESDDWVQDAAANRDVAARAAAKVSEAAALRRTLGL